MFKTKDDNIKQSSFLIQSLHQFTNYLDHNSLDHSFDNFVKYSMDSLLGNSHQILHLDNYMVNQADQIHDLNGHLHLNHIFNKINCYYLNQIIQDLLLPMFLYLSFHLSLLRNHRLRINLDLLMTYS